MNQTIPTPPPKVKFQATKADGTVTTLEVEAGDVLSAAALLIGPGRACQMDKDGKPLYRISVHEITPKGPELSAPSRIVTP